MRKILPGLLLGISFYCLAVNAQVMGPGNNVGGALMGRENARFENGR